jgi:hypothetical protein
MANGDDMHNPKVVTISREALRADLAELELRLRLWIGSELASKADVVAVEKMEEQWRNAEQGLFTPAQTSVMKEIATSVINARVGEGWSRRERAIALIGICLAALATVANFAQRAGVL